MTSPEHAQPPSPAPVRFVSTRRAGIPADPPSVALHQALAKGLAPDGGLYVPEAIPELSLLELRTLSGLVAPEKQMGLYAFLAPRGQVARVAEAILTPWFQGDRLAPSLRALCEWAYAPPIRLRGLTPSNEPRGVGEGQVSNGLLELFHGSTGAFKDFAARFLAEALTRLPETDAVPRANLHADETPSAAPMKRILVATSGDTGSAVGAAFLGRPGFQVSILYPVDGVSTRQAHLLSAFGGNVQTFAVRGTFDAAQALVKEWLQTADARGRTGWTSANSISLGRLLPQMAWFAWAGLRWREELGVEPGFIIPSGNFGHGLAALWARAMGLPIGRIVLATNENRLLVDVLEGRALAPEPRTATRTPANAMDVGVPSNLERFLGQRGQVPALQEGLRGMAFSSSAILDAVARAPSDWGTLVCPHTACGILALEALRKEGDRDDWIVAATAHPAKFPEIVEPAIGAPVPVPPHLNAWLQRPAAAHAIDPNMAELERHLWGGATD